MDRAARAFTGSPRMTPARAALLLALAALHAALLAAMRPVPQPSRGAARLEVPAMLLPAPANAVAPVPAAGPALPRLSLPALAVVAPLAFDLQAADEPGSPPAEAMAVVAVVAVVAASPTPGAAPAPRAPVAAEPAVQPARRAACAPAPHPLALRERGIEGVVRLRVWVDEMGHAGQVLLAGSSGWRLFDDAAVAQARRCPFQPALRGSQPVGSWVEFPVRFALETSNG